MVSEFRIKELIWERSERKETPMMANEKLCLRWNDFESNISGALGELREDQGFFDVTLACDEDQIQAHKVILFWLYFLNSLTNDWNVFHCKSWVPSSGDNCRLLSILPSCPAEESSRPPTSLLKRCLCTVQLCIVHFSITTCKNLKHCNYSTLFPPGVKLSNLKSVLDFMYNGEVNVAQEELNTFLNVAEDLKVKGLTRNQSSKKQNSNSTTPLYLANHPCLTDRQPEPLARKPNPTSVLQPKRRLLPFVKNNQDYAQESGSVKSELSETTLVRQHQVVEAHPSTLKIMGDYGADNEEQKGDFSQIEGEAYYAPHGGDLNRGKSLSHVLVTGLTWVRQLQTCFFSLTLFWNIILTV